jgi:glycosylphosphatidylinositol transamidase (GPIT) subunit GPI8
MCPEDFQGLFLKFTPIKKMTRRQSTAGHFQSIVQPKKEDAVLYVRGICSADLLIQM